MLCTHICSPVFGSSAITDRRVPPVVYNMPFTMSGVPSSLYSGNGPRLSVLKRQATSSLLKFDASIWARGRYLVPFMSAVYEAHSVSFGRLSFCPPRDCPPRDWAEAPRTIQRNPAATGKMVHNRVFALLILITRTSFGHELYYAPTRSTRRHP